MSGEKKKITWISILQGFTMLLVVVGHSDLAQRDTIEWTGALYEFFQPFRMPLFLFISGYLFYLTRIAKHKSYGFVVGDKLKRLGIPLLCFTIIGVGFKFLASSFVKNPIDVTGPLDIVLMLIGFKTNALSALWFVQVTLLLMMFYPLYQVVLRNKWVTISAVTILLLAHYFFPVGIDLLLISKAVHLWIFFFAGMVLGAYRLDRFLSSSVWASVLCIGLYVALYLLGLKGLPMSIMGIIMSLNMAHCIERYIPSMFRSFRNYTYQIYLMSIFPQMAIEMIYRYIGCEYFGVFYLVNIAVGLYFPILVVRIVERLNWKWARMLIGLS